jgi:hypothetical protein
MASVADSIVLAALRHGKEEDGYHTFVLTDDQLRSMRFVTMQTSVFAEELHRQLLRGV